MASIERRIRIGLSPQAIWPALADLGALHTRLVKGFVIDCRFDGRERWVRFANGQEANELIVDVDERRRRVAWSARSARLEHHHASAQVREADDGSSLVVWQADLLPDAMAPAIATMIEQGLQAMRRTLEGERPAEGDWAGG
jgi:Polyketide cyclase / dehydrase and lipid transport